MMSWNFRVNGPLPSQWNHQRWMPYSARSQVTHPSGKHTATAPKEVSPWTNPQPSSPTTTGM